MKKLLLMIFVLAFPVQALAEKDALKIADELSSEFSVCAAYYAIVSECLQNTPSSTASAQSVEDLAELCMVASATLTDEELSFNRTLFYYSMMMEEINNRCERLSILSNQHLRSCSQLMEEVKIGEAIKRFTE